MRVNVGKDGKITILDFSAVQAYKIAAKMEKNGIAFYKALIAKVKDEEARREIKFFIKQEEGHLAVFEGLLSAEKEATEDSFEEDDLINYVNSRVFDFSQERSVAENMDHRHAALEEAMDMEKRSIVFYEGCLAQSSDAEVKKKFEQIIEEEKKHLSQYAQLLRVKCINSQKGCIL